MAWKQVKTFDINKMGHKQGLCLNNVRLGFGVPGKYADAKAAMEANKSAGTLHPVSELQSYMQVPVFIDTTSRYEHVIAYDKGVYYSDGKRLSGLGGLKPFGWGETLNGVRIVEWVADPAPAPTPAKKTNEQIANEVIAGKWGNGEERKRRLTESGYNYGDVQAIVNVKVGKKPAPAPAFAVGDLVVPTRLVDYRGRPLKQYDKVYTVSQLSGDRAVLMARGAIWAAMNVKDLRKV